MHRIKFAGILLLTGTLALPGSAAALESYDIGDTAPKAAAPRKVHPDAVPADSQATTRHWKQARAYQKDMRLELARQEYLLALAACRSDETKDRLQRELQIVELQLRTLR